ncbi:MAG: hypothetical protein ABSC90_01850 [Acidimicrobiales bacterium]|jgi:hypothetical protein
MGYVVAGYVIVLGILFLYGAQLAWRRRRLTRAVARVTGASGAAGASGASGAVSGPTGERAGGTR